MWVSGSKKVRCRKQRGKTSGVGGSGIGGQPGRQVTRAREVEQGIGQGFQLTKGQGLDLGGDVVCEEAAAAVEEAKRDCGFTECLPLLATLRQPVLHRSGVPDLLSGNTGNHHDLLVLDETSVVSCGKRCTSIGSTTVSRTGRPARIC